MLLEAQDTDFALLLTGEAPHNLHAPDSPIAPPEVLQMLRDLANTIRPEFAPAAWMIVEDSEVVGLCSVTRPPTNGHIDIGYGIAPTRQQRGIATRAIAALLEWARNDERVSAITAETSIHNQPSQLVLERNGFQRTGERTDPEDGELFCWTAPV